MTALSAPISLNTRPGQQDDFVDPFSHPAPVKSTGPLVTFFQAIISFGLLPLLLWPARWAEFLDGERQDLFDLVTWWRWRVTPDDAAQLDKITKRLRPRPILMVLPWLAVGFNVVLMATLMTQGDGLDRIWDLTFKHAIDPRALDTAASQAMVFHDHGRLVLTDHPQSGLPLETPLFTAWMVSLLLAYGCQWYAVRSHTLVVHSLVKWTNKLERQHQFARIKNDAMKIGIGPGWIIAGFILCAMHAWWAIPMVLAGALQRRYSTQSSPAIRIALAGQTREASAITRTEPDRFCRCGGRLPSPAKFCPRCGTAV